MNLESLKTEINNESFIFYSLIQEINKLNKSTYLIQFEASSFWSFLKKF